MKLNNYHMYKISPKNKKILKNLNFGRESGCTLLGFFDERRPKETNRNNNDKISSHMGSVADPKSVRQR